MSDPPQLAADILVGPEVPADQEAEIVDAFRAVDVTARTRVVPTRRGAEGLPWLVLATLPLQAFLTGLGVVMAEDVTKRLKGLVARVLRPRRTHPPAAQLLVLQDAVTRLQVVLEPDLPAEAYQALLALDLSQFRHGPLHYDRQLARWRSELDEAR
ncbi:MAG TPA: hypothetical protein VHH34_08335 [Pseudonocardiaceae bacterium]|nr:hypothetical protein [Pseudonocardiaceae bacterium]